VNFKTYINVSDQCSYDELLVAYLYGELSDHDVVKVDDHLAACSVCVDELAAVSLSRFSVLEWQQTEFAPLATPSFDIPYHERTVDAGYSFGERLSALWFSFRTPAFAGSFATLLLIAGFVLFNYVGTQSDRGQEELAVVPAVPTETVARPATASTVDETSIVTQQAAEENTVRNFRGPATGERTTRRSSNVNAAPRMPVIGPVSTRPTLSGAVESEDVSLRLEQLFDEVGG
jgi:anti-sigma factor RsiW